MGIGNKLAKLLEANDTNANELAKQIDVSPQTIYSIIKRDSKKADIEVLLKIADVFGVNAEYFVYDNLPVNTSTSLSSTEIEHIKKYRELDDHGKEMVDIVLDKEHDRILNIRTKPGLLAAHARTDVSSNPVKIRVRPLTPSTLAAHFDGEEYTDDEMNEIRHFSESVKNDKVDNK